MGDVEKSSPLSVQVAPTKNGTQVTRKMVDKPLVAGYPSRSDYPSTGRTWSLDVDATMDSLTSDLGTSENYVTVLVEGTLGNTGDGGLAYGNILIGDATELY